MFKTKSTIKDLFYPNIITDDQSLTIKLFRPDQRELIYNAFINIAENSSGRLYKFKAFVDVTTDKPDDPMSNIFSSGDVVYSEDIIAKKVSSLINRRLFESIYKKEDVATENPHDHNVIPDLYSISVDFIAFNKKVVGGHYLEVATKEEVKNVDFDFEVFEARQFHGIQRSLARLKIHRLPNIVNDVQEVSHGQRPFENDVFPFIRDLLYHELTTRDKYKEIGHNRCYLLIVAGDPTVAHDVKKSHYGFSRARIEVDSSAGGPIFLVEC